MFRCRIFFIALLALCGATAPVFAQEDGWRAQVEFYRDATIAKAREARTARQEWTAKPTPAAQAKFNRLADEAHRLYKHLQSMEAAIRDAERANDYRVILGNTIISSVSDMGGYISDAATRLFGASDDELYGPNWQIINGQYAAMHEKYRAILERKKAALAKPENTEEVLAIQAEIDVMKKKYEVLRQMIRMEQRNLGVTAALWGEDGAGRYIKAITENLDVAGALVDAIWVNPKIVYTVLKPGIMLYKGDKYIYPAGNLTPQIADSIVLDVMGIGPTEPASRDFINGCVGNIQQDIGAATAETLQKKAMEMLANRGAADFNKVQNLVMQGVRQQLEAEMEKTIWETIKRLPYDKLPAGNPAQFGALVDDVIKTAATRTRMIEVAKEGVEESLKQIASLKRAGFVRQAMKPARSGVLLANIGPLMDLSNELITLSATSPATYVALEAANMEAGLIRKQYRDLVAKKVIDKYEQTEDEYLNAVWGTKWKYASPGASKSLADALADDAKTKQARAGLSSQQQLTDALTKKMTPAKEGEAPAVGDAYVNPWDAAAFYVKTTSALEQQFDAGDLLPRELLLAEADAFQVAADAIATQRAFNAKVLEAKLAHLDYVYQPQFQQAREALGAYVKGCGYANLFASSILDATGMTNAQWNALSKNEQNTRYQQWRNCQAKAAELSRKADVIVFEQWRPAKDKENVTYRETIPVLDREVTALSTARETCLARWTERAKAALLRLQPFARDDADLCAKLAASPLAQPPSGNPIIKAFADARSTAEAAWWALKAKLDGTPRTNAAATFDAGSIVKAVTSIAQAEDGLQRALPPMSEQVRQAADALMKEYENLVDLAATAIDKDGAWATLACDGLIFGRINNGLPLGEGAMKGILSPESLQRQLLEHARAVPVAAEAWLNDAQALLGEERDGEALRLWCAKVTPFAEAFKEMTAQERAIVTAHTTLYAVLYANKAFRILEGDERQAPPESAPLAMLCALASTDPAAEYVAPTITTAAWLIRAAKVTVPELQTRCEKAIPAKAMREDMGAYEIVLETANAKLPELREAMTDGHAALTRAEFPGFGQALGIPVPTSLTVPNLDDAYRAHRQYLRRLANLEQYLTALPAAYQQVAKAQADYLSAVKGWHLAVMRITGDELTKIETLLAGKQWKDARIVLTAIPAKLPTYPLPGEGAIIENTSVDALGLTADYAKLTTRRQAVELKISEMEKAGADAAAQGEAEAKIRELYQAFKVAYESRNEMKVLACLAEVWTAGDGTDLDDLTKTLHNSFTMYDQVRFVIGPLTITKFGENYRVSYDVTITGRVFDNDLKHEEKSTVTEEVAIDAKGKARIIRTTTGRFWYVE